MGHGEQKTIPKRRFRRRVGLRGPLPGARSRRRSTAHPRPARGPKRAEVDRADRLCLALHATRLAALGGGLPADEAVATGGRLRGDGPRFARTVATFGRQSAQTDGRHPRLSHPTLHPGERLPGRLRRSEAKEGLEDTRGGGHFGTPARPVRHSGLGAGQGADGRVGPSHPRRNRRIGGACLRG